MEYQYTINDLQSKTGFSMSLLRKLLADILPIIPGMYTKGEKNALLFNNNALVVMDKVKQMKDNGLNLPSIKKELGQLEQNINSNISIKTEDHTNKNIYENKILEQALKVAQDMNQAVFTAKDKLIEAKEQHINELKSKLLLITDGKAPEIFQAENKNKDIQLALLNQELENKRQQLETFEARSKRHKELLLELNNLKGYFQGKRRKLILQELQTI